MPAAQVTLPRLKRFSAAALADLSFALAKWEQGRASQADGRWVATYFLRWQELLATALETPPAGQTTDTDADGRSSGGGGGSAGAGARSSGSGARGALGPGLSTAIVAQALWSWAELRWPVPHSVLHYMALEVQVRWAARTRVCDGERCTGRLAHVRLAHMYACRHKYRYMCL